MFRQMLQQHQQIRSLIERFEAEAAVDKMASEIAALRGRLRIGGGGSQRR